MKINSAPQSEAAAVLRQRLRTCSFHLVHASSEMDQLAWFHNVLPTKSSFISSSNIENVD